jgi:hypothetical protein
VSRESTDTPPESAPEAFIERWSRRKTEAKTPASPPALDPTEPDAVAAEPEPPGDEDMVPVESLTEDSDYKPFLSPRVSAELQRLALRKLFASPSFNLRDGLDDYDEDFTTFAPLGNVLTADIRHRLELEAERRAAAASEAAAQTQTEAESTTDTEPRLAGPAAGPNPPPATRPQPRADRSADPEQQEPDEDLDA